MLVPAAPDQLVAQEAQPELLAPLPAVLQVPQALLLPNPTAALDVQAARPVLERQVTPAPKEPLLEAGRTPGSTRLPTLTSPSRRLERDDELGAVRRSGQAMSEGVPMPKPAVQPSAVVVGAAPEVADLLTPALSSSSSNATPALQAAVSQTTTTPEQSNTPHERLREMVLAIDANARFVTPSADDSEKTYFGKVVLTLGETTLGIAQFSTQLGAYVLHTTLSAPPHEADDVIEVQYKNGQATAKNSRTQGKGGRGD